MNHLLKLSSAHLFCHFISRNEEDLVISYRDESISYEIILLSGAYSGLWESKISFLLGLQGLKPVLRNQATLLMYEETLSL